MFWYPITLVPCLYLSNNLLYCFYHDVLLDIWQFKFCPWQKTLLMLYLFYRDEGVHWGVQNGLYLSRSTIVYFKHNDMTSLESTLDKLTHGNKQGEKIQCYIVVEAVYQVCMTKWDDYINPFRMAYWICPISF